MAMVRTLMNLAAIAMMFGSAMATNHTVGAPNGGWDQSTDLTSWAASKKFSVGDNLIFVYGSSHDVLEVKKADYDSCQTANAISTNVGGMSTIPLSSPGKRYFICGTPGHCDSGMKLEVNTLATTSPPPAATPPIPSPPSAPSTTPVISPAKSPALSPSPKSPLPSPKHAPKISPKSSPAKSPVNSPSSSSTEAPALPPSSVSVPTLSPPSWANKLSVIAGSSLGFGFVVMMMFDL